MGGGSVFACDHTFRQLNLGILCISDVHQSAFACLDMHFLKFGSVHKSVGRADTVECVQAAAE